MFSHFKLSILVIFISVLADTKTVFSQDLIPQEWWQSTTVYQIYPRSFKDTDNDGIGDLKGIIEKLDYLKNLGIETIWISPFYQSPWKDFGYDIGDYYQPDSIMGSMKSVELLIEEVHKRDMKIVFDMVLNHTSNQHPWFLESKSDTSNSKRDWYVWKQGKRKKPPTNWKSMTGGSGWTFDVTTNSWYWSSFLNFQPDLNYHNPEVKKAMFNIVKYWLRKGVDGFRLDIFNAIYHDENFGDNPFSFKPVPDEKNPAGFFQKPTKTINHPLNFQLAKELRAVIDSFSNPKRFVVGEVFGDNHDIKNYLGNQDGLNLIFLFQTLDLEFNKKFFHELIQDFESDFPHPYTPTWVFSNHDRKRSISRLDNDIEKARILALIQLTSRGVPFIYQGEEIGMGQAAIKVDDAKDPLTKKYAAIPDFLIENFGDELIRDGCRTPMQWNAEANAGFTSNDITPWLPVNPDKIDRNVATQQSINNSLLGFYKKLLAYRKSSEALKAGKTKLIPVKNKNLLVYQRIYGDDVETIVVNFSKKKVPIPDELKSLKMVFSTNDLTSSELIFGLSGMILK